VIKYQNQDVPVFSIPPDWSTNVTLTERYGGLAFEALSTAEERLATQPRPLLSLAYDTLTLSEQEQGYIRKILEVASAIPIALPLWQFQRKLTADVVIGNAFVKCDLIGPAMFDVVPACMLWNSFNYFETFRTFVIGESEIGFDAPITKQFAVGDIVVPIIVGHIVRDDVPAVTDSNSRFPVKLDEQFLAEMFATPNAINGSKISHQPPFEYLITGGPLL
jgi:hypothetical protein